MNENKLKIIINRSIREVFNFTINPKNTSLWISQIQGEVADQYPPKIGTIYKNKNSYGKWNYYSVIELKEDEVFTLKSSDENYHVRYTYVSLSNTRTEMEYFEWVEEGELEAPFTQSVLRTLKEVMERRE